jgi:protein gp37
VLPTNNAMRPTRGTSECWGCRSVESLKVMKQEQKSGLVLVVGKFLEWTCPIGTKKKATYKPATGCAGVALANPNCLVESTS